MSMAIVLQCEDCGKKLRVNEKHAGRRIRCPECDAPIDVPSARRRRQPAESGYESDYEYEDSDSYDRRRSPTSRRPRKSKKSAAKKSKSSVVLWSCIGGGLAVVGVIVAIILSSNGDEPNVAANGNNDVSRILDSNSAGQPVGPGDTSTKPAVVDATNPTQREVLPLADLIERIDDGVVMISVKDSTGQELGFGTGFVVDATGLVATNFHVLEDGDRATAQFRDGSRINIIGLRAWDVKRDLAIVQLAQPPENVEVLQLGQAATPRQGTDVIAIGHPRGFQFTTTTGIVSAVHTTATLPEDLQEFLESPSDQIWIQTNATIAGGSSGGPLLNSSGEVVGINTWITTDVDFGFAAHVSHLSNLLEKLEDKLTPLAQVSGSSDSPFDGLFDSTDAEITAVLTEHSRGQEEFLVRLTQARTLNDRQRLLTLAPARRTATQLFALAKANPKSKKAYQALMMCLTLADEFFPASAARSMVKDVTDTLLRDHISEETLGLTAMFLLEVDSPEARSFLDQVSRQSPHKKVQGMTCFALAMSMINNEPGTQRERDQVVALLERVVKEFSDLPLGRAKLGALAEPMLFQQKYLGVGCKAPEIVGRDVDGTEFKLSDFRGKVVMLDFFADWCPICSSMYPQERTLVQRYKDRPFALLGVNCDSKQRLQSVIQQKKVTWKTWWDDESGPIATRWRVGSFPTIYIIDHKGIIRHRLEGRPSPRDLEMVIARMIAVAENKSVPQQPTVRIIIPQISKGAGLHSAEAWINANNRLGPGSNVARDLIQKIKNSIAQGNPNVELKIGSGLLKSQKAAVLSIWDDQMAVFDLTPAQATRLKLKSNGVQMQARPRSSREAPAETFRLHQLSIDGSDMLSGSEELKGEITYSGVGPASSVYVIRVSHEGAGGSMVSSFHYLDKPPVGNKLKLPFKVPAIDKPKQPRFHGPLVVHVELCTIVQQGRRATITAVSDSMAILVNIK
jgi:S1-C subfamily serine protease/peroxiredoxin